MKLTNHNPQEKLVGKSKKRAEALRSDIFSMDRKQIKDALDNSPEILIEKLIDSIEALSHDAKTRGK